MKPGRNDPCYCGSGKKYKHCCEGKAAPRTAAPSPDEFNALVALYNARRYPELEIRAQGLLGRFPDSGLVWKLLGASLQTQGKNALLAFQKAAALMPGDADAHYYLGNVLKELGRLEDAAACYRKALKIRPVFAEAQNNLGLALRNLGQVDSAIASFRRAVDIKPGLAEAHYNLGNAMRDTGQFQEAVTSYRRTIEIKPDFAGALSNLGLALRSLGQYSSAETSFRRALEIDPNSAVAHLQLGNILTDLGRLDDAAASYRHALEITPDLTDTRSNLMYLLNFTDGISPAYYLDQARQYGVIVAKKADIHFTSWQCAAKPDRLRVGLVSGDLRTHSVGHFLVGVLSHIDPARIELIAYPTNPHEDELTARIRPIFSAWKPLVGLSDGDAARMIHGDGVHVLLDVSGFTAHNRLPVFAWKPAPVQVTWLGLPSTTGMKEMDYVLGDLEAIPMEIEHHFTETVWRMPDSYLCFSAPAYPVEVAPLPALSTGYVTFGSFNNLTKLNDAVVELWSRILLSVPDSRLYLKSVKLLDADICELTRRRFAAMGIEPERLILGGRLSSVAEHLAEYNKVDVALDTFPYTGTTTSVESLWMGVPVLTLHGDRFLSLTAKSVAHHAGLPDWVAIDKDDYVAKAVAFTSNLERLAALRAGLRQQVLASPLFDAPRFARNLEDALWGMWQARNGQE
jgi:predicted O-linked N-acetylglucosamine transferase (SPINDLY family)